MRNRSRFCPKKEQKIEGYQGGSITFAQGEEGEKLQEVRDWDPLPALFPKNKSFPIVVYPNTPERPPSGPPKVGVGRTLGGTPSPGETSRVPQEVNRGSPVQRSRFGSRVRIPKRWEGPQEAISGGVMETRRDFLGPT